MIPANNSRLPLFVFFLCLVIAIVPVLVNKFFPTVDGPAHLYNAKIIRELLAGDADFYREFFKLNAFPVPNWTGHILAIFFGTFLPVWMTEKIIVLLIVCGLPLSLVHLAKAYGAKFNFQMLLTIPFTYTITLYLGFFNYMLALPLMFVWMGWLKKEKFSGSLNDLLLMALFLCLLYFSHLMIFMLTLGFTVLELFIRTYKSGINQLYSKTNLFKIAAFIPGIILSLLFFGSRGVEGFKNKVEVIPIDLLWKTVTQGGPLIGLNGEIESLSTTIFMTGITVLLGSILGYKIYKKQGWKSHDIFLLFAAISFTLYFIVPDGIVSGGFVSLRLLMLFMIFIVVWIMIATLPLPVAIAAGILGIYTSFSTLAYRYEVAGQLNEAAQNVIDASEQIKPGTVLLPLNYSGNWLHINISNYIGANKKVIVLDNYEAVLSEFPVQWQSDKAPGLYAGNFAQSLNPNVAVDTYEKFAGVKIDYVSRWNFDNSENDSLKNATENTLKENFGSAVSIDRFELFGK